MRGLGMMSHRAPALAGRSIQRPRTGLALRPQRKALTVAASSVALTVAVAKKVEFGESIKMVGNEACLGAWDLGKGVDLTWTDGDVWRGTVEIPVGAPLRFKLVRMSNKAAPLWEDGADRELTAEGADQALEASCNWCDTKNMVVKAVQLATVGGGSSKGASLPEVGKKGRAESAGNKLPKAPSAPPKGSNGSSSSNGNGSHAPTAPTSTSSPSDLDQQAGSGRAWVGAAPEFVRSKPKAERQGQWTTEGLQGVALDMVKGDEKAANWLSKLDLIKSLLVDRSPMMRPGLDEMAFCYIYATWINTGAIMCAESGGHHRPNHHSNLALQMFRSLEWVIGDTSQMYSPKGIAADSLSVMAARRMHNRLPSISGEFRQSVPLTRIRDIAHRGDIPKELKDEIKHTLQNKLHRSAGPEDLIASEAMLKRITARPGEYSADFVEQFKLFMKELREFFNASGLEELLMRTQDSLDDPHASAVSLLLANKKKVEAAGNKPSMEDLMSLLFSATQVRTFYAAGLSAGLRTDVRDDALEMRQRWRLSEIRLEEYCFVVLSRIVNVLEEQGGAASLSNASNNAWALPLSALTAGLRNLGLSQFKAKELLDLENELQAWHTMAPLVQSGKDNALRAKASVDRVVRLAAEYSDALMKVYAQPAAELGRGLSVPPYMASVFAESEVRSSVAFQVSKLASLMSKALRIAAGQSAWDGLVTGESVGVLTEVESLSPSAVESLASKGKGKGLVLSVRGATGDEELGPLVPMGLSGVVLRQELPHLSHLGVRARQEKVTFATLDDEDTYKSKVRPLLGKQVKLAVLPNGEVSLKEATQAEQEAQALKAKRQASMAQDDASTSGWSGVQRVSSPLLVPLAQAYAELCGSKAAKCADLERLAIGVENLFRTPVGCCLPFGTMELAVAAANCEGEYKSLLAELERPDLSGDALDQACTRMQRLVEGLALPGGLLEQVCSVFTGSSGTLLAVRSSANVEDLAGMSAAGLYESVVGVPAADQGAVSKAVGAVWASLYSRRAVMARRAGGVPQSAATMCVLIQELFAPKVSFVLHTARPSDGNADFVLAEAAPGQGETLAAATQGTPWRWEVDKTSGSVSMLAFANFSRALLLSPTRPTEGLVEVEVDYSKQRLSVDPDYRTQVARRLALVGCAIEAYYDKVPQDIEGGLVATDSSGSDVEIFIFQTRPQH